MLTFTLLAIVISIVALAMMEPTTPDAQTLYVVAASVIGSIVASIIPMLTVDDVTDTIIVLMVVIVTIISVSLIRE